MLGNSWNYGIKIELIFLLTLVDWITVEHPKLHYENDLLKNLQYWLIHFDGQFSKEYNERGNVLANCTC